MNARPLHRCSQLSLVVAGVFALAQPLGAANTDIANEPLTQSASNVQPNVMFILDDSGSMSWDYSPDYVDDTQSTNSPPTNTAACFDSGDDDSGAITGRPDACRVGDSPYMSPDFNKQYYNPDIWYRPGVNADGSDKASMNAANTSNWTAVPTDPYGQQQDNQLGNSTVTENLMSSYPDRVWCRTTSDNPTDTVNCQINSAYTYPNHEFNRTSDSGRYRFGNPYYYRMQTAQWCSTPTLNAGTCVSGSAVNPNVHFYIAPEFCTDSELVNCAAGAALTPAHLFAGPRWCSDQGTLLNCQRKKVGNFRYPKHLGTTEVRSVNIPARAATGTLTVFQTAFNEKVNSITIGSTQIISGVVTSAGSDTTSFALQIRDAINAHVSTPDYTATASGAIVTVSAAATGVGENGKTIVLTSTQTGTVGATATIDVDSSGSNSNVYVDGIEVAHPTLGLINIMSTSCSGSWGNGVSITTGGSFGDRILATNGTNAPNERSSLASAIAACITQGSSGFSATSSGEVVTVTAPATLGALMNGRGVVVVKSGSNGAYTTADFFGGVSTGAVVTTSGSLSGGAAALNGSFAMRLGVGKFARVNVEPTNNTYPKASGRFDCAGATCTYAEEMTNFANWYAYYRTRMQMMKSAAGRAFVPIDDTYRMGFITINPGSPVSSSRYLRIQDFDATHKTNWYNKFYVQRPTGGTPLREALSRVGRLYAGQFDGINDGIPQADDPMQVSCQPNFAILSTDGYWTTVGTSGNRINGTAMTQQDNVNQAPYSTRADGVFDGNPSGATVGLADTALYYYQTDLRPAGSTNAASVDVSANNVPTTQADFAAHQHMTTFTLGLGLDGTLSYRRDYQTATTGDFLAIKQGTLNWPNPVADSPQALDDLWHAAVNGRGVFFSASNPQELANSLTDTLDALKRRVGSGAAAATSNLQPVPGDNFAFTAIYETQTWTGDVRAFTIDLATGDISTAQLWSAQTLLSGRAHTDRRIYTFDPTDPYVSTSTGETNNQLKHFCMSGTPIAPWCTDGAGLTAGEQAYFNPSLLPQSLSYGPLQVANATPERLVNYLRGEQAFEDQGNTAATDLFRERTALLGDFVGSQPVYVKSSPLNYSDPGYAEFKSCSQGTPTVTCPAAQFPTPTQPRRPTVYINGNDGMLHAFETDVNNNPYYQTAGIPTDSTSDDTYSTGNNAGNGVERWAYIPGILLPELRKLASVPYNHRYFADGSPTAADICLSAPCTGVDDWRTIIVAGLNAGGRGYFALDITNPLQPRAMWEFKVRKPSVTPCAATPADAIGATDDCDLGLTFGNPMVTKLKATGRWVVVFTSGLNNTGVEPATTLRQGDGKGYLFVLDAATGRILHKIPTNVGDPGTALANYADADPSGLSRASNWVDNSASDNTTLAVYAGDMKGNLWRFDLDNTRPTYLQAIKVAELKDSFGLPQPVTTRPELTRISGRRVIYVGTGRFLGVSDKADTSKQTIYAISDDLAGNTAVTSRAPLVAQTLSAAPNDTRTIASPQAVNWLDPAVRGWLVDLPDKGERVNVDPRLQLGTLTVASNVPSTDSCVAGGTAWVNNFDFRTGGVVTGATNGTVSTKVSDSIIVGITVIQLPSGSKNILQKNKDDPETQDRPEAPSAFEGRRVGWRELNADQ